jgi:hypothetical protein
VEIELWETCEIQLSDGAADAYKIICSAVKCQKHHEHVSWFIIITAIDINRFIECFDQHKRLMLLIGYS